MLFKDVNESNAEYDVVICGGGLAGQTLARQLKLHFPDVSVALIDKSVFPLPEAACKVGESTVEIAAFYFAEILRLKDYFKNDQLTKLGLRYFFGDSQGCISERPEVGLSSFSPYDSFQIDRGIFENDLCRMNQRAGVDIIEGSSVQDIQINEHTKLHTVAYKRLNDESLVTIKGKWVIDAMSRRCFLTRKFKLKVEVEDNCSAAWFRVKGRFDFGDTVPEEKSQWHQRVPNRIRFYSTTHFMGRGYWVWVIPLSSGNTSIGIVTLERIHPLLSYNHQEKAYQWLQKHEPRIFELLENFELLDFLSMKNYGHSAKQVFSKDRWACTGEAGVFSDPFYSPGSNMIGFSNSSIVKMIEEDANGTLTEDFVSYLNTYIISYNDWLIKTTHRAYPYFGNGQVMSLNFLWDITVGWSLIATQMFSSIYLDQKKNIELRKKSTRFLLISLRIKQLFLEWEQRSADSFTFEFIDYLKIPFIREIYERNLEKDKPFADLVADQELNLTVLDDFAQAIFYMAVEDTMPEKLSLLEVNEVNEEVLSLSVENWEKEKLLRPISKPRENPVLNELRRFYFRKDQQGISEEIEKTFNFNW
jgi:flavin-dependent dehydrogenase